MTDGDKDDLLRVVAQPGLETLRKYLGRVEKGADDGDILGGELGVGDGRIRLVLLAVVVGDQALDVAFGSKGICQENHPSADRLDKEIDHE